MATPGIMVDSPGLSRRPFPTRGTISTVHRDLTDERYRELRRPRRIRFYVNGDRYFQGRKLAITPHRYINFTDLLGDLTGKLPKNLNLPYGVRQIFTPDKGHRITEIDDLKDGGAYVCGGFEVFKPILYGKDSFAQGKPHNHQSSFLTHDGSQYGANRFRGYYGNDAFYPGKYLHGSYPRRQWQGTFGSGRHYLSQHDNDYNSKPKVITVIRNGKKPRSNVKILLNRRSVQSYEQLLNDISEAFGPKWKNNKLRKLFTTKGYEVKGVSDFFRDDNIFVGVGNDSLTEGDVQDILEELFPDSPYAQNLVRQKRRKIRPYVKDSDDVKRDSGLGEGSDSSQREQDKENRDRSPDYVIYRGRKNFRDRPEKRVGASPHEYDMLRFDREREKAAQEERERVRRRQQKMQEAEQRAIDEDRRKRGLVPVKAIEDPFKKFKEQRQRERDEAKRLEDEIEQRKKEDERKKEEERKKIEDEERKQKHDLAEQRARDRQKVAEQEKRDKESEKNKKQPKSKSVIFKTKLERQISSDTPVLEKYELGRTLGDGNFAVVKQCKLKATGQEYAMKIIDKPKLKGKEYMVENEIEVMKDCSHPNLVKLYEEYETPEKIYLVMELVKTLPEESKELYNDVCINRGGDLFDAITQSVKFGEVDSAHMVMDLCHALFYLHSRGIVHRDLKPENLLVHRRKDGSISLKLADFGLAMEVHEPIHTVCGTPTYVAPEILSEIGYGLEVDMWAVGVIAYILLSGFPPFRSPDRNQTELFEFIKAGEYEFLSPYWDNISSMSKDLIEKILIVDKEKRYTAIDVLCHPWIMAGGNTSTLPRDRAKVDEMCVKKRKELNAQAKQNMEQYKAMKRGKRS